MTSMSDRGSAESCRQFACRLRCGVAQPLVQLRRLPESQHIPAVGSDCRLEVFTVIGIVDPTDPP
jgi:hypothetical protein